MPVGAFQEWPRKADFADRNNSVKGPTCGEGAAGDDNAALHRKQIPGFGYLLKPTSSQVIVDHSRHLVITLSYCI